MCGRQKQNGGFLPILGTLAKPLLVSATGTVGGVILKGLGSKVFGGGKRRRSRKRRRPRPS